MARGEREGYKAERGVATMSELGRVPRSNLPRVLWAYPIFSRARERSISMSPLESVSLPQVFPGCPWSPLGLSEIMETGSFPHNQKKTIAGWLPDAIPALETTEACPFSAHSHVRSRRPRGHRASVLAA